MGRAEEPLEESPHDSLERAARALLVTRNARDGTPRVQPVSYWFDGGGVWVPAVAGSDIVGDLQHDPSCAIAVASDVTGDRGALVAGHSRVYSLDDPVGLVFHAPTISAAVTALMLRNARALVAAAPRAAMNVGRGPAVLAPAVVRITVQELEWAGDMRVPAGVAPALPLSVPPDVRRALAGVRSVLVASVAEGGVRVLPAAWSAGFSLVLPEGSARPARATPVVVVTWRAGGTDAVLALSGMLVPQATLQATLRPSLATWWHGGASGSAAVGSPASSGIVLPD